MFHPEQPQAPILNDVHAMIAMPAPALVVIIEKPACSGGAPFRVYHVQRAPHKWGPKNLCDPRSLMELHYRVPQVIRFQMVSAVT